MIELQTIEIQANGFRFEAAHAGEATAPLVLLLHGFPQTLHAWRHQLPALADAGFYAVAPNQRGYSPGARPRTIAEYRTEFLIEDALAIADRLGAALLGTAALLLRSRRLPAF